jgi:hypothetical protein
MGNLRQSMTDEQWDELSKRPLKTENQLSMKYTIDTQNKTLTIEQCNVYELTDLLTKLKQVHSDIHLYDVISKTVTIKEPTTITSIGKEPTTITSIGIGGTGIPNPYVAPIVPYIQPMRYEDMFKVHCLSTSGTTINNGTNRVESKL